MGANTYNREDLFLATLTVDGKPYGTWQTKGGGEQSADNAQIRPAGSASPISLGGPINTSNVSLSRTFDRAKDGQTLKDLRAALQRGAVADVNVQPLDRAFKPYGPGETYTGTLVQVTPPDVNSGDNNPATLSVEIAVDDVA